MRVRVVTALALVSAFESTSAAQSRPVANEVDSANYAPEVMAAARQDVLGLRECYDRAPRGAWRQVRLVTLVLGGDGSVRDLRIDPRSEAARAFRDCMLPIVRNWHLPAPPSHAQIAISYPADTIRAAVEQIGHDLARSH
jgi:hypothetical protein